MNQRTRTSRIIDIALTSAGLKGSLKCKKKINFDDEPVALEPQLVMDPDPNDGILVENLGHAINNENMDVAQDYSSIESQQKNEAQFVEFIPPSPSNDYIELQNCSLNANFGEKNTDKEPDQPALDPSAVVYAAENLNFTNSNLSPRIDQPTTSTGHELIPSNNLDEGKNLTQPLNSMYSDTQHDTVSKVTKIKEIQSNSRNIVKNKRNVRKCRKNTKYIDYMSDQEDFSTFYGDSDDSDDWLKGQSASNEETDDPESTGKTEKKKKNFRRREPTSNGSGTQEETVDDAGLKERKINERKERSKKKRAGEEYTTKKGVTVPAKKVLPNPCRGKKCGNDCGSIPEERRESIFKHFWKLDTTRRRDWLVSLSQRVGVKRKRSEAEKRTCTIKYFINEGEGKRNVCLQFLAATINVSDKTIYSIVKNAEWGCAKEDMRGKSEPSNKTKQTTLDAVINFIKRLPAVPSHYGRQDSSKVYLPEKFKNIPTLYGIYKSHFVNQGMDVVSERIFRKIFDEKFNIGFHVPKKDKCKKCLLFKKTTDPDKLKEKQEHEKEKEESYSRFKCHKNVHKDDPSTLCVSFDLQKVLNTPYSPSMLLFYSRKLAVYNLCFYENGTRKVFCFYWDESNGKRGANEVATILQKYIKSVDARGNVKRLLLYCDCSAGQNRNRTVMGMIHQTLQECDNIKTIQLNFLLTGHTYMPVDSSHAIIENHLKQTSVYAPSQWFTIFSTARKNPSPFNVERLSYEQFKKWDNIGDKYFKGNLTGKISKVRIATFKKGNHLVSIKTSMNSVAKSFDVEAQPKTRLPLLSCYRSLLPISKKKYDDLHKLCTDQIIPACFHHEYLNIPRDANIKDVLPESDIEDPDYDA